MKVRKASTLSSKNAYPTGIREPVERALARMQSPISWEEFRIGGDRPDRQAEMV